MIHINPIAIATGLKANILPINLNTSSANLKTAYAKKAGIRKIARYIHVDEIPKTVSGKGYNKKTKPTHKPPTTRPIKAAHGISFRGFKNKARPVTINRYRVPESQACIDQVLAAVTNKRTPIKNPKSDVAFTNQLTSSPTTGAGLANFSSSHEAVAIPPKIKM